jgi:hypothetical protein
MMRWWAPAYWQKMSALIGQRERLALLLWPFLSARERTQDDAAPLWLLARMVRSIEAGHEEFAGDVTAQRLWAEASVNPAIREAATDLRTLRLQLAGSHSAATIEVVPTTRQQLRHLRTRMHADQLDASGLGLHAPLLVPLLSALFLFSGWLFNYIFFGHFGMPVGRYYGLSDYLAASFDGLVFAVATLTASIIYQWFARNRIRLQTLQNRLGGWRNIGMSALALFVVLPVAGIQQNSESPEEQRLIITFMVLLAVWVIAIQIFISISRRPARDTLLLSFVYIYLTVIWYSAELRYLNIDDRVAPVEVTLVAAPDQPILSRVVSGNSLYLFLMNDKHELTAVPIDQVLSVRYINREPYSSRETR